MTETFPAKGRRSAAEEIADLRRVGINPDFWYPVAASASVRKEKTFAAKFAGQRIALYRGASGAVYALEDRCAHRQMPLSMGVVEGDALRCCYHAWAYRGNGRILQIPYLPKGADLKTRPPRGVRGYPVREAYGLVFVFPGDPDKAATTPMPQLPHYGSARHKTMTFSRTVACHYSFLHENLLDMNHQFLHLRGDRICGVFPVGGLRARGRRAAYQPCLRPAHDRQAAGPRGVAPGLAVHPPLHRAGVRRGPDGRRGRATGLGRARPGPQPRGLPPDPRPPRGAAVQRRPQPPRSAPPRSALRDGSAMTGR
jgi:nitrite reductase/ring-hydroxylating ferredoxin subunit